MRLRALTAAGLIGAVVLPLTSCSDDEGGGGGGDESSAEDVLADAKADFDETSGLSIKISTDDLPEGVTGIVAAEGVGTHAPAFEGTITVIAMGASLEVPVVGVDGVVYAQVPFSTGFQEIDPADYGAPDPARLMSPDEGFSTLLTETTDLDDEGEERNPDDPEQILRTIRGTVPGSAVENVIPSAEGDFEASYGFEDGELRTVVLTGEFYPDSDAMTYTLTFDDYGSEPDISAP